MNYAMDNTQALSPQTSIDEALAFLGMSGMDKATGIRALLRISEDESLPLFFDEKLVCVPTSVKYGDQYDEDGEFVDCLLIDPDDTQELWSGHTLANFQLHMTSNNSFDLIVSRIIHADVSYHIYQTDGTLSEGVSVGYEKFHFDRKSLIGYKDKYHSNLLDQAKPTKMRTKTVSITERRVYAFKIWLIGESGKSVNNETDLQSCYESIGSPTKPAIWDHLSQMDRTLFSSGKHDFIRAISTVIRFKQGTGTGRNTEG